jgi:hypothetical protein
VSSVDQAVIDLVEGVSIWGVQGLEVASIVHEVRTFDQANGDQSEAIFICTLMQAVLAYRWLMYAVYSRHDLGRLRMPAPIFSELPFSLPTPIFSEYYS